MKSSVAVFLKAPRAGTVKTRLAAEIGDAEALRLYRLMAANALDAVRRSGCPATVWFAPADAREEMARWLGPSWPLEPQSAGDLGARLAFAAQRAPAGSVWLAIGGDCPRLRPAQLHAALDALLTFDAVLGPTNDGGYYLIGGRAPLPDLFGEIAWSTEHVLDQTRARLRALSLRWRELPVLRDVDTVADARAEGILS